MTTQTSGPTVTTDIAIIGSGMGGGTLAYALRDMGARVLVIERGDFLPAERQNWDAKAVFSGRYKANEEWIDATTGKAYGTGMHYWVGGNTKMYGAALTRFRAEDFGDVQHHGGVSPAWPVSYDEIEPYYGLAEALYRVRGKLDEDHTEPHHSMDFPFPPLDHEPGIARLDRQLRAQGLHPFHLPMGINLGFGGGCVWCGTCDGFPCMVDAKSDADVCAIRPALTSGNVEISTRTRAIRLRTDPAGRRVVAVEVERDGQRYDIRGGAFVLAAGAANTTAILLRSGDRGRGLANGSDQVGRNYMQHHMSAVMAIAPRRDPETMFQKTIGVNDFYLASEHWSYPMGSAATFGKLTAEILHHARPWVPTAVLDRVGQRSTDWWLMTEDLPVPDNRVTLDASGRISVRRRLTNHEPHRRLVRAVKRMLSRAGYPVAVAQEFGLETNSHHCGTARMGTDPANSVVDPNGRTHDIENLHIADSSVFPASGANNPSLTIAALAFRMARLEFGVEHLAVPIDAQPTQHRPRRPQLSMAPTAARNERVVNVP